MIKLKRLHLQNVERNIENEIVVLILNIECAIDNLGFTHSGISAQSMSVYMFVYLSFYLQLNGNIKAQSFKTELYSQYV